MNKGEEIFFGDKETFAIRYIRDMPYYSIEQKKDFAFCHLVLNGQVIGNDGEECYLPTWAGAIERIKDQIKYNFDSIQNAEFEKRSDEDLFELIWKANQLEEEFKVEFNHLPVLDNSVWSNCALTIDETIDAYLITMTELDGKIKLMWKRWWSDVPDDSLNRLFSVTVDRLFVVDTLEKCLKQIEEDYVGLRQVAKG